MEVYLFMGVNENNCNSNADNVDMEDIRKRLAELERNISAYTVTENDTKDILMNREYGLCLGGGGGKGAYQVGVYKALADYGLINNITSISGASIGALNGLLFTMKNPDSAYKCWSEIDKYSIFEPDAALMFNDKPGFASSQYMLSLVDTYVDYNDFKKSGINLYMNTTIIDNGDKKPLYLKVNDLEKEKLYKILSATSALPMINESVTYDGMELMDGGLTDNLPVKPLYDNGVRNIIIVGLNREARKDISRYSDATFIEIYPSVDLGDILEGTLNFSKHALRFREKLGYRDAMRALKVFFEADPVYIKNLEAYEQLDYKEIMNEIKREDMDSKVKSSFDGIENIVNKYGDI
jgi:NTE family protein